MTFVWVLLPKRHQCGNGGVLLIFAPRRPADQHITKQNAFRLVHAKVNREYLFDAPIGHWIADQNLHQRLLRLCRRM